VLQNVLPGSAVDVAIIGAGPYGLSIAAHLQQRGVEHRIFGTPMQAWRSMSAGMHLKSVGYATSISTPDNFLTLPEYCRAHGAEDYEPIPIATFAEYGTTVQEQVVPYLEQVDVTGLRHERGLFRLTLATGEEVAARRVVVAIGLTYFERMPRPFDALPKELVCHTAVRGDFTGFDGWDVTVIGAGQSALQAAALLHEHGAEVRLLAREGVKWGGRGKREWERSIIERVKNPMTVLGHGRDNWKLEHFPWWQHMQSDQKRLEYLHTRLGPGGAWWLRDRVEGLLEVETNSKVVDAQPDGDKVRLVVSTDGDTRDVLTEYVVLGTGYDVDVDRISFIDPSLAEQVARIERAPRLDRHFESSVSGLYFVGPSTAASFGPLFRFVAGSYYCVPVVSRHLSRHVRSRRPIHLGGTKS
jgi:cation diffusion facilitator CzcD-associated flavoprotein CzcO